MNGAHDLGGMHGFGALIREEDEPVFAKEWQRRVFAMTLAMGASGEWNLDMMRSAREARPASDYFAKSYFEIWLSGLLVMLARRGLVSAEEMEAGRKLDEGRPVSRRLAASQVEAALRRGGPTLRAETGPARYSAGDLVRMKRLNPATHTRLPRYVWGCVGRIERVHGCHVFADSHAIGAGEDPRWLYTVSFSARDLWGEDADPNGSVSVEAWEPYLEPAAAPSTG